MDGDRSACGWFAKLCGRRAPALGLIALFASGWAGCGGDGDENPPGAVDAGETPTCEERRIQTGRSSIDTADPIIVANRDALPRLRSAPLPPVTAPPPRRAESRRAAGEARSLGLRLLLITPIEDRPSYRAAAAALQRIAVPHDVLLSTVDELEPDRLYDESGGCRYAGVILSHTGLVHDDGSGWQSTFTDDEWALLAEYEQTCGAREVILYASPTADVGLTETGSFDGEASQVATLTAGGQDRFSYLVDDASLPITGVYGYLAAVSDAETTVPLLQTAEGAVLAAIHTRPDMTEVLAMTFDGSPDSLHSQLFEFGIVEWVSGGIFIGKRRIYLAPHIDDVFLASYLWSEGGGEVKYRMTSSDVARLRAWWSNLSTRLPSGSSARLQLAFNGAGSLPALYPDQSVVTALLDAEDEFFWINHTWSHANLDHVTADAAVVEIRRNCDAAAEWGLTHFRCDAAVTPEITGLMNPDAVAGMLEAGVRMVVSDASRDEQDNPDNPGTNPSPNVGRANPIDPQLFQIPRHPTSIFFNVSTVDEEVGLYNEINHDRWGRDLTYAEILEHDTGNGLAYLLSYDVDPLMFHQANLRFWDDGGWHSLFTDWMDLLIDRFTALVDLPIIGLDMNGIARVMKERHALDQCALTATLSADRTRIHLESAGACVVPITGIDAPDAGEVQNYRGVPTTHVTMSACDSVDVALP